MALSVYLLCAAASLLCAILLWRGYRASRAGLLFWASLCFFGLTITNSLLVADLAVFVQVDMSLWRLASTLTSLALLLYGLIFETQP